MTDKSKADEQKRESASKEFSSVVDATSEFLKKMFPHAYALVDKLRGDSKKGNDDKTSEHKTKK